ncbi:MAG: RnfABCDGE type electron transport complex subunit G [Gammaproteobacteria bacterium]
MTGRSTFLSLASLAGIVLVSALLVAGTWQLTRERIAENDARGLMEELAAVLPAGLYNNAPRKDRVLLDTGSGMALPVYRARQNGTPVAAALTVVATDGYTGPITLLVGVAANGRVTGVQIVAQTETAGIGSRVQDNRWLDRFAGHSLLDPLPDRWTPRADGGDFDAVAGATVSSRAVIGGVRRAVQYFASHRDAIFAPVTDDD